MRFIGKHGAKKAIKDKAKDTVKKKVRTEALKKVEPPKPKKPPKSAAEQGKDLDKHYKNMGERGRMSGRDPIDPKKQNSPANTLTYDAKGNITSSR